MYHNDKDVAVKMLKFVQKTWIISRTLKALSSPNTHQNEHFDITWLLYGYETWPIREQDKYRKTSAEMKFMRRTSKYTFKDYRTNEVIFFLQNS